MISRRCMLQRMAAGAAFGPGVLQGIAQGTARPKSTAKRVIFFLQNQGFDPKTCVPDGLVEDAPLAGVTLPEPISPLGWL